MTCHDATIIYRIENSYLDFSGKFLFYSMFYLVPVRQKHKDNTELSWLIVKKLNFLFDL